MTDGRTEGRKDRMPKTMSLRFSSKRRGTKIKNYFLDDCVYLEIRLTHGNKLLLNITRNKRVAAFSNLFK